MKRLTKESGVFLQGRRLLHRPSTLCHYLCNGAGYGGLLCIFIDNGTLWNNSDNLLHHKTSSSILDVVAGNGNGGSVECLARA